ncbi:hypothetical protein [Actinophytocola xanthii]|uniref:Uncharacterized protein n=1 Tax=Actinophytocola xanthii TaxID=1912961 RepID=A0A1Q8CUR9_9PSEU|nr:hypothetical protein [Actinophytocola xanthii]OLF18099.1 hypothetical protein BU204_08135 [Actinophytocola xanthii]
MTELRTACHGCRQVTQYRDDDGRIHPMILPGNGTSWAERLPGGMVEQPCLSCGECLDPGWLPGLVPPA